MLYFQTAHTAVYLMDVFHTILELHRESRSAVNYAAKCHDLKLYMFV